MESRPYSWVALDPECEHPREEKEEKEGRRCNVCCNGHGFGEDNAFLDQDLAQANINKQVSEEAIIIRDSCDINVTSTDVQAVASVMTAINAKSRNGHSLQLLTESSLNWSHKTYCA